VPGAASNTATRSLGDAAPLLNCRCVRCRWRKLCHPHRRLASGTRWRRDVVSCVATGVVALTVGAHRRHRSDRRASGAAVHSCLAQPPHAADGQRAASPRRWRRLQLSRVCDATGGRDGTSANKGGAADRIAAHSLASHPQSWLPSAASMRHVTRISRSQQAGAASLATAGRAWRTVVGGGARTGVPLTTAYDGGARAASPSSPHTEPRSQRPTCPTPLAIGTR